MDKKILWGKCALIAAGSAIGAYGMSLAMGAGLGGGVLGILWQGLSARLPISIGTSSFLIGVAMLIFAWFYDRSQIHIGTVLYQVVYSPLLDVFAPLHRYPDSFAGKLLIVVGALVIFATGIGMYSGANLGRGSYEAVVFGLAGKKNWQVSRVKMVSDAIVVLCGWLLGGVFGLCTIISVLIDGPIIGAVVKLEQKLLPWLTR